VQEDYNRWVEEQHARIIVKEAAILIESGAYKDCDKIVVVTAPIKVRIERVVKRDHLTEGEVLQRILHQMDDEERKGYANFVIVNDGILPIEPQVDKILYQLQKTYEGR
jgi:dephospho-CoA kinase